jgi:tRNA(adenine34) deaminase
MAQDPSQAESAQAESADAWFMREAIREAKLGWSLGEVPVGCVLVDAGGAIVGRSHNTRERDRDPLGHAELLAIRKLSRARAAFRLLDVTAYVTLEPCPMCAGALVLARVARVVYGCADPKAGAVHSMYGIGVDPRLNHRFAACGSVLETECSDLLQTFFRQLRKRP